MQDRLQLPELLCLGHAGSCLAAHAAPKPATCLLLVMSWITVRMEYISFAGTLSCTLMRGTGGGAASGQVPAAVGWSGEASRAPFEPQFYAKIDFQLRAPLSSRPRAVTCSFSTSCSWILWLAGPLHSGRTSAAGVFQPSIIASELDPPARNPFCTAQEQARAVSSSPLPPTSANAVRTLPPQK